MTKKYTCKICGMKAAHQTYLVKEMMFRFRDTFTYFQCKNCECLQIENFPKNISDYYPTDYYSYSDTIPNDYVNKFRKKMGSNTNKDLRILDVGCGSGHYLYALKEIGFKNLLGVDPFIEKTIYYKNGLVIEKKSIHEVEGEWDIVLLNHSFEHMPDQIEALQSIKKILYPKGYCKIAIPTVSSLAWELYRENWVQLDAPRHYFLHSEKSLLMLAKLAGLTHFTTRHNSTARQFWGSIQYQKDIPLYCDESHAVYPDKSIFNASEIEEFETKTTALNQNGRGDCAEFFFR